MFAFIGSWGWQGIVVIGLLALILFGSRGQIPAFMRDIGRGINSFRSGLKEGADEAKDEDEGETPQVEAQEAQVVEVETALGDAAPAKKRAAKKASAQKSPKA